MESCLIRKGSERRWRARLQKWVQYVYNNAWYEKLRQANPSNKYRKDLDEIDGEANKMPVKTSAIKASD